MSSPLQMQVFLNVSKVAGPFKGVLLDAYGVFWGGNTFGLLPGSKESMEKLVDAGKTVGILSNSTQLASSEASKLLKHGLEKGRHYHFLITSGEVAKRTFSAGELPFETPNKKFWIFGGIHPRYSSPLTLFEGSPFKPTSELQNADFIYISIPHVNGEDQTDSNVFAEEVKKLQETGLPMVCANPDRFAHEGNPPRAVVRQGSIAKLYEELGGRVFYIGKPHSLVYRFALDFFEERGVSNLKDILMVGDNPKTDVRGANIFGIASALTTETGIMADRKKQENGLNIPPRDQPSFFVERL